MRGSDILLIIVAIFFPPAAAAFIAGCGCELCLNILLTCLGYIPGHIHAFWLIYKRMKAEEQYGRGGYMYQGSGKFGPYGQPMAVQGQAPAAYGATAAPAPAPAPAAPPAY
ncbi:UPF0057-domain-containing protein [Coniophora puteana RWD-64-598 SS2]|uniref:UPF0057-domain-containing protein n=1 Tax=Coniophora puteana (strain RWD-64-598) TaxID=741705 RepID=A0A5M3MQS2_CONPW|nr:UPF0057-domain-containing protein [Coniophora puteana RWD-64-598 SS2]EIW81548.1 UPF0057-domain-containing protein [Coniophora puteana RWD-64-598 SS2]